MAQRDGSWQLGIEGVDMDWLENRRVGLVAHPASVTREGVHSADWLWEKGVRLTALFGPEHGFWGRGGAGERVADGKHEKWGIPVFSLYGETRVPTAEMLSRIDTVVFDLQTVACRAYTYGSTLRGLMEVCAAEGKRLIVADRPDPLMLTPPDGPMLCEDCASFVGWLPMPFCHGLTAGEVALALQQALELHSLDLRVARCNGLSREMSLEEMFPDWRAPSPALGRLENALCFPLHVFFEALPLVDHARGTSQAFESIGGGGVNWAAWPGQAIAATEGVEVTPTEYADKTSALRRGLHFRVTNPRRYRPAHLAWELWQWLTEEFGGTEALWQTPGARPDFYAKLWGTRNPAPPWPTFSAQHLY